MRHSFIVKKLSKFRVWLCTVAELIQCQGGAARKDFAPGVVLPLIFLC